MLIRFINAIINSYLEQLDPASHEKLAKLDGKTMSITIKPWQRSWQILIQQRQVYLLATPINEPILSIAATPLGFLGTLVSAKCANPADSWLISDISISGDLQVAQQLITILTAAQTDWEALIATKFGHGIARIIMHAWDLIRNYATLAASSMRLNLGTYLSEEQQWVPPAPLLADFIAEVDDLVMRLERLTAILNGGK